MPVLYRGSAVPKGLAGLKLYLSCLVYYSLCIVQMVLCIPFSFAMFL